MNKIENRNDETPSSIYLMHKYWGKKPSKDLREIIKKYSNEKDKILDPFAGFGGIAIEGTLLNRNVIINDLNPIANFINKCVLEKLVDLDKVKKLFEILKKEYKDIEEYWYKEGKYEILTTLRDKNNIPIKNRLLDLNTKKVIEEELSNKNQENLIKKEDNYTDICWYPNYKLIINSRICIKEDMKIADLFPRRALICQAYLWDKINKIPDSNEKDLIILAFTSNLANCSKLVPPIKSRGDMSQGAWMTGFYIGEKYLENNVFHYFENRIKKIIKGKAEYIKLIKENKNIGRYEIRNEDAKNITLKSNSIDMVFTDFPYGDTVPYFEQSQLWNAWLKNDVDYKDEIVISNSNERNKDKKNFSKDISKAIDEIVRILKYNSYFIFTYHSLDGEEWIAINNAIANNELEFVDCDLMLQKTFTPRQLNRKISIKGDMIVIYRKNKNVKHQSNQIDIEDIKDIKNEIIKELKKVCKQNELYSTNNLITKCVKILLKREHRAKDISFIDIIRENFNLDAENNIMWRLK